MSDSSDESWHDDSYIKTPRKKGKIRKRNWSKTSKHRKKKKSKQSSDANAITQSSEANAITQSSEANAITQSSNANAITQSSEANKTNFLKSWTSSKFRQHQQGGQETSLIQLKINEGKAIPQSRKKKKITESSKATPTTQSSEPKAVTDMLQRIRKFPLDSLSKDSPVIVIPLGHNKSHPSRFSMRQLNIYKHAVEEHRHDYKMANDNQRFEILQNIITQWLNTNRIIIRAVENQITHEVEEYEEMSQQAVYAILRKSFTNSINSLSKKSSKQDKKVSSKSSMNITDVYKEENLLDANEVQNWNYFSMIHSLYSSFSIYMYNYSHRVKHGKENLVHACTKVKLLFPEEPNFFIIFHGRTVHSGGESRLSHISSIMPSKDL